MRFINFNIKNGNYYYDDNCLLSVDGNATGCQYHFYPSYLKMQTEHAEKVKFIAPEQFKDNRWILGADGRTIIYCDRDVSKIDVNNDSYLLSTGYYQSTGLEHFPVCIEDCYLFMNADEYNRIMVLAAGTIRPSHVIENKCCCDAIMVVPKTVKFCNIKPEGVFIYNHLGVPIERREWYKVKPKYLSDIYNQNQRCFYSSTEVVTARSGAKAYKHNGYLVPDTIHFYNHDIVTRKNYN